MRVVLLLLSGLCSNVEHNGITIKDVHSKTDSTDYRVDVKKLQIGLGSVALSQLREGIEEDTEHSCHRDHDGWDREVA